VQYSKDSPNGFRRESPPEFGAASPQDLTISNFFFGGKFFKF